jgi:hypothetical protein
VKLFRRSFRAALGLWATCPYRKSNPDVLMIVRRQMI